MYPIVRKTIPVILSVVFITATVAGCAASGNIVAATESTAPEPAVSSAAGDSPPVSGVPSVSGMEADEYLKINSSRLVLDDSGNYLSGLEAIDTSKYEIFLGGESHATKKSYDAAFAMLQFLHKSAGVKYILLEDGFGSAAYLNIYLQTGDPAILEYYIGSTGGTFSFTKKHYDFWRKVYAYNQSLPAENRLTPVGLDLDHQPGKAVLYLKSLAQSKAAPEDIKDAVDTLLGFENHNDGNAASMLVSALKANLQTNEQAWRDFLKDDYFNFDLTVENCAVTFDAYAAGNDAAKFNEIRESAIIGNFKRIYPRYSDGKFFGQWGSEHIYRTPCDTQYFSASDSRFAIGLEQEDSPVRGKVCSILYVYENGKSMNKQDPTAPYDILNASLHQTDLLSSAAGDLTLFDLEAEGTPFSETVYFLKAPTTNSTLDYFQYILLIRNSEACTPFSPH